MKYSRVSSVSSRNGRVGRMSNACELLVANNEDLTPVGTRDYGLEDHIFFICYSLYTTRISPVRILRDIYSFFYKCDCTIVY